jgi:hypothetical protein
MTEDSPPRPLEPPPHDEQTSYERRQREKNAQQRYLVESGKAIDPIKAMLKCYDNTPDG